MKFVRYWSRQTKGNLHDGNCFDVIISLEKRLDFSLAFKGFVWYTITIPNHRWTHLESFGTKTKCKCKICKYAEGKECRYEEN